MDPTLRVIMLAALLAPTHGYYSRILDKADNVLYMYPKNVETVAAVEECEESEPCSIVSKRFWLPRLVIRSCRCKELPCNTNYSPGPNDVNTVQLDNRSQFKMCSSGEAEEAPLPRCEYGAGQVGVSVEETRTPNDPNVPNLPRGELIERKVRVHCRCLEGYWQLSRHTLDKKDSSTEKQINLYHCNKLSRCQSGGFCGHVRWDTHSAYYRCSCPKGTLCINTDKMLRNASELLYEGPMYRAYCHPVPSIADPHQ